MITENVKNLFSFIDFLHSNIDFLLSKQPMIDELLEIKEKRDDLSRSNNYKDKLELRKVQENLNKKWNYVQQEVSKPITDKIEELNIVFDRNLNYIRAENELLELQRNFEEIDLKAIFLAKEKYLEFRNKTDFHYFTGAFFFDNLDRTLNEFYEVFKDEDFNAFDNLKTDVISIELNDEIGLEKAVRKIVGITNKLHFETFPDFLNYFKTNFKDVAIDERYSEAKRIFEQKKLKLENSTFQSEIDEIKEFSESAVKEFKDKLLLSFTNENYKTEVNGGINPYIIVIAKLYFEYESLYNNAKNKCDNFSISYSADNSIEFRNQKTFFPFPVYNLFKLVTNLRETLLKEDVCAVDLQEYPDSIFNDTELKQHPNLAGYIYNIIYTWINDIEISLHSGNKKRLFDDFLALCKEKATNVTVLEPQQKQESKPQISTVSNDIESAFSFMKQNDPRKHKRIISDDDFDSLMKWITYYFENNFTIPEIDNPIKVINTNKGYVVYTFIKIFKELHPTKTRPDSLFELIKLCFYDYRNDNISNYKKQKEPQFYSELINKK